MGLTSRLANRPTETTTGVSAAVVAVLVATTHLSTGLATALVGMLAVLPGFVTAVVSATRSTATGTLLVSLTPTVAELARDALDAGKAEPTSAGKTAALRGVTDAISSWTNVLHAESGVTEAQKQAIVAQCSTAKG